MKRVAVIGAGAAGLAALRSLGRHKDKLEYVAFEISDRVGGTWILNDPFKPTSMYNQLRTNLPKEVMAYPGFPFSNDVYPSFVSHKNVLDYLESFAKHYQLHQYIQFRHNIEEVDPVVNVQGETEWKVTAKDCQSGHLYTEMFDSVLVCNGHYTVPYMPEFDGQDTFTGEIMHSHYYRLPHPYVNKTILILGAGPSGVDIATDLSPHASKIYLSHNKPPKTFHLPDNLEQVAGIDRISGDDIILKDGSVVQADMIMFATGYRYSFPFLSKKCHPDIEDEHVKMIYKLMVDIRYPSLYYIGLNCKIVPFPQFSFQCDYAAACIAGEIQQEAREVMEDDYKKRYEKAMSQFGRQKYFHHIRTYQWEYNRMLADESHVPRLHDGVERLYEYVHESTRSRTYKYKDGVYRLSNDEPNFAIVDEPFQDS